MTRALWDRVSVHVGTTVSRVMVLGATVLGYSVEDCCVESHSVRGFGVRVCWEERV